MRAVNLLPAEERRKGLEEGARTPLLAAAAGIALVTVLATILAATAAFDASDKRSQVDALEEALASLPDPERPAYDVAALTQERSNRESALAVALSGRVSFDSLLRQISLVLPEDAWLTQLNASLPVAQPAQGQAGGPAPAAATDGVTIQGATWSHDRVAVVVSRLAAIPTLTGVRLTSASRVAPQGEAAEGQPSKPHVTFVISANVNTGDES
jgi:Tfp pilus assembly protein PilN